MSVFLKTSDTSGVTWTCLPGDNSNKILNALVQGLFLRCFLSKGTTNRERRGMLGNLIQNTCYYRTTYWEKACLWHKHPGTLYLSLSNYIFWNIMPCLCALRCCGCLVYNERNRFGALYVGFGEGICDQGARVRCCWVWSWKESS